MSTILQPAGDDKTGPRPCTTMGCFRTGVVPGIYGDDARATYCRECASDLKFDGSFVPDGDDLDCGHHSWAGLMALLDEHWPADIFPTRHEDDPKRDAGARIVSLMRWVDQLRTDARLGRHVRELADEQRRAL